jgi:hypothetical protein
MIVTGCSQVRIDKSTGVREIVNPHCGQEQCDELTQRLANGTATAMPGLRGWGNRTHTVTADDPEFGASYYHATIDD